MDFKKQFKNLKKLNLPTGEFVVVGSGPLSVRGIRESLDIDVIVTQSLWDTMVKKYPVGINSFGAENLELENDIEILNPAQSIFGNSVVVPVDEIFDKADVFDGVKFINLNDLSKIKLKLGREKDLKDIELINQYLFNQHNNIKIFCLKDSKEFSDYELLDTGEGEKLEKFGPYVFVRALENAFWKKTLSEKQWNSCDGKFWSSKTGAKAGWKMNKKIDDKWEMEYKGIKFLASPTAFRHLSFFPEQATHWDFIEAKIRSSFSQASKPKFLNLFGYTGVASLFALRAGAEVTHVDASKQSLNLAKENQKLNAGLVDAPMRIIEDDVLKFLERELKRGNKYDAIIMDPPKFGRGPKGETWKIEESLPKLLSLVKKVLSDKPLFVILTSYAVDSSALSLKYALEEIMKDKGGVVEAVELCVLEKSNGRYISLANTAVWSNN